MAISIAHLVSIERDPPKKLIPWLRHQASLTEKLKTSVGEANLVLLEQNWFLPTWWDKFTLGIIKEKVFHRKILMVAQQRPCWYAQTIVPQQCYESNTTMFDRLMQESVGAIVFGETSIKRVTLLNYGIDKQCIEYYWLPNSINSVNQPLWLRFSEFKMANSESFYLIEILLPGLLRILDEME